MVVLCFVLPPLGIYLVLQSNWMRNRKIALTCVSLAVMLAVVAMLPSGDLRAQGGVVLIGSEKKASIYGPELPESMVEGYTVSGESVLTDASTDSATYVYAAKSEEYYHAYTCRKAYASSQRLTVYEAYYLGYKPCPICNPEEYTPIDRSKVVETSEDTDSSEETDQPVADLGA